MCSQERTPVNPANSEISLLTDFIEMIRKNFSFQSV